jgi:hypothetical protein
VTELLPETRGANLVVWAVVWGCLVGFQLLTSVVDRLPSIVAVVRFLRRWWLGRCVLLFGWAWLGVHLFARTSF